MARCWVGESAPDEQLPTLEPGTIPAQARAVGGRRRRVAEALRRAVTPVDAAQDGED